ncbi:CDK5 regulatory subunit-associated protein 3 [Myotis brandtii]|uniref:CDK5 regulatory subunit-associated protein 3 n=1 Tax=Myotis brandtii TaxID=109478 RepID=S7PBF2_MYOBR|nr:CDK5 regulatory subunit-associated protein 3 [Myotis brandtii]
MPSLYLACVSHLTSGTCVVQSHPSGAGRGVAYLKVITQWQIRNGNLNWLVDRRHCNLKWQSLVLTIREKINAAIQDMPESEEIAQLLSGSYIHYFHCLRIVDLLKGTEASTKNIFGRYSSQRMKASVGEGANGIRALGLSEDPDWQEIVALYEKDNSYLVELSSLLVRNVTYEIPSLKKQIAKCQQLQQEYSRKEEEGQGGAAEMREQFYHSCKQYGITGDNVRRELLALVKELPSQLAEIGARARSLGEAIDLYQACVGFVCESPEEQVLPMLRFVQKRGNSTVYEWRTGTEPTVVERPHLEEPPEQGEEDAIDWGDFGVEVASEGTDPAQPAGIDWGISLESDSKEAGGDGIDWGDDAAALQITVVEAGTEAPEGVARGSDALTLLEYPETRNQFIDELMELEIFLSQRAVEMSEEADILSVSQFQLAPAILQGQTKAKMETLVSALQDLIGRLTNLRMQHLFMILASPRYVDRVTEFLQQKLKQSQLLALKKELMVQKQQEALQEQAALEPKLDLLLEKTKELQKLIEADISKRYNGRPVNLMGTSL